MAIQKALMDKRKTERKEDAIMAKMTKKRMAEKMEAIAELRAMLKPKDTIYCILRKVSRSGMKRVIDFNLCVNNEMRSIGYLMSAADVYGTWNNKESGMNVGGCGMDMGFAVVYNLGRMLWPNGTEKPHGTRNGEPDASGGYALKHSWL